MLIRAILAPVLLFVVIGAPFLMQEQESERRTIDSHGGPSADRGLAIVDDFSSDETPEMLRERLELLISEVQRARQSDIPHVYRAIAILRKHPDVVKELVSRYHTVQSSAYDQRVLILQIIGELRRVDALGFLQQVVWQALPEHDRNHGLSSRDREEIVRVKAVHGVGYLRRQEAFEELLHIMQRHKSRAVSIAAIDTYMWNQHDSETAASLLYGLLQEELHPYIERPRFYRGMDLDAFDERVRAWHEKWGSAGPRDQTDLGREKQK